METEEEDKKQKPDSNEYEERMAQCMKWLLYDKMTYTQFSKHCSKVFGCTVRTGNNYWTACKDRIKEKFSDQLEDILTSQLARYFVLLKRAHDEENDFIEIKCLQDISKLTGIEPTKKVDLTSGNKPITISINLESDE